MDGDEVSNAAICPTTQCSTCRYPIEHLSNPDVVNPFRDTADVRERVAEERKKLLHREGWPRDRCREKVLTWDISVIWLVFYRIMSELMEYLKIMSGLSQNYERNITKL
jgi:hypothetical protein